MVMKLKYWTILLLVLLGSSLGATQVIKCGETSITLVSRHYWNLNSLDFAGINLCRNRSYFGNVARFNCGWVGSGHKENKIGETELKVNFFADGKEFVPSKKVKVIEAKNFELKKSSVLLDLRVEYILTLEDGKLTERAKVTVLRDTELKLLYLFMHPWCPIFESALCQKADGSEDTIRFNDMKINGTQSKTGLTGVTYFAPKEKLAATTTLNVIKAVPRGKAAFLFWNRGVDRKLYFQPVNKQKFKAGETFEYELTVTIGRMK